MKSSLGVQVLHRRLRARCEGRFRKKALLSESAPRMVAFVHRAASLRSPVGVYLQVYRPVWRRGNPRGSIPQERPTFSMRPEEGDAIPCCEIDHIYSGQDFIGGMAEDC